MAAVVVLSLYVDQGVARHAWLAAPVHGSLEGPRMGPGSFPLYLGFLLTTCGTSIGGYGLAPLPCWPMLSDPGPLARFLLICLGVHRSPFTPVCVYVVIAWLSFGPLLCVRPAPSADPWAPVPRCAICGALGASTQWHACTPSRITGCCARALSWPARLLRSSTGVPPTKEASAPPVSTTATSSRVGALCARAGL
ncbi:hypothetical protein V6N12_050576 [Hibiscus sabdariffa]|uniref:Uncharacterized protein n=1 Tax=Hibiscus sabdariffa TaxID=183260 RepID=A0ABR2GD78_9ROSI